MGTSTKQRAFSAPVVACQRCGYEWSGAPVGSAACPVCGGSAGTGVAAGPAIIQLHGSGRLSTLLIAVGGLASVVALAACLVVLMSWSTVTSTKPQPVVPAAAPQTTLQGAASPRGLSPPTSAPAATPTPAMSEEVKAEAVELLGAAAYQRESGQLGLALEMGNQALAKWPGYADARQFVATVAPQATVAQAQAITQATAAARAAAEQATAQARAQATAQAQAQATSQAQGTAQAQAQATAVAAASLRIVSITSPAARNSSATLVARTMSGAQCDIDVVYASGSSRAAGLGTKTADAQGMVRWTWQIGGNTSRGEWPIEVECILGQQRWTASTELVVS